MIYTFILEGKEASGECPQFLLIQQRDEEDIVPQLKEILQLEQACPPDSDSKRADTLITPNKTTGELIVNLLLGLVLRNIMV